MQLLWLPDPLAYDWWGFGLDELGRVSGYVSTPARAIIWLMPDNFLYLGGDFVGSQAVASNITGQVVGWGGVGGNLQAVIWYLAPPPTPTERIANIQSEIDAIAASGGLSAGNAKSLSSKAAAAAKAVQKGKNATGENILNAMLNQLDALLKSTRISPANALNLQTVIQVAIDSL